MEEPVMKLKYRYLIKGWSGFLFEAVCIEESKTAFKIHNVIQNRDQWLSKKYITSGVGNDYKIIEDLGPWGV